MCRMFNTKHTTYNVWIRIFLKLPVKNDCLVSLDLMFDKKYELVEKKTALTYILIKKKLFVTWNDMEWIKKYE